MIYAMQMMILSRCKLLTCITRNFQVAACFRRGISSHPCHLDGVVLCFTCNLILHNPSVIAARLECSRVQALSHHRALAARHLDLWCYRMAALALECCPSVCIDSRRVMTQSVSILLQHVGSSAALSHRLLLRGWACPDKLFCFYASIDGIDAVVFGQSHHAASPPCAVGLMFRTTRSGLQVDQLIGHIRSALLRTWQQAQVLESCSEVEQVESCCIACIQSYHGQLSQSPQ